MSEENVKPKEEVINQEEEVKSQSFELIERARKEREGLNKENARMEKNIKELRELEASRLLGGTAGGHIASMTDGEKAHASAQKLADEMTKAFR